MFKNSDQTEFVLFPFFSALLMQLPCSDVKPILNLALVRCLNPSKGIFTCIIVIFIVLRPFVKTACGKFYRVHQKINLRIGHGWVDG